MKKIQTQRNSISKANFGDQNERRRQNEKKPEFRINKGVLKTKMRNVENHIRSVPNMSILPDDFSVQNRNIEGRNTYEEAADLNIADIKILNGKIKRK